MKDPARRDQAVVDKQAVEFATGFANVAHFMGPGPFAVGDQPTIGDCALAPFIGMLQQVVFPFFSEISDPTKGDGRLAVWWGALQNHPVCKQSMDDYDKELASFLIWLAEMMAKRGQGGG